MATSKAEKRSSFFESSGSPVIRWIDTFIPASFSLFAAMATSPAVWFLFDASRTLSTIDCAPIST
ncbi:MAG: hypothetical protein C0176_01480 [Mesoaciditoga sp.]|nr:MAG: hypothetical protein C0185_00040 [Mesoaciditoga sp.]PMP80571.1 MAG: hypothetical protein C0176_01480 [Mesoaciditoga sp.]